MEHDADSTPPPAYEHRAPSSENRPFSKLAIWALVTSLLVSFVAATNGLIWLAVPPLLLSLYAVVRVKPALQRGHWLAVAALVVSVMGGSCSYLGVLAAEQTFGGVARGVLAALASENEGDRLDDWLTPEARDDGAAARIRARYEAAVAALGPYAGEIVAESRFRGALPYKPPNLDEVEEFGVEGESPAFEDTELCVRARFRDGIVRMCFRLLRDVEAIGRIHMAPGQDRKPEVVEDVRFFRDR